MKQLFKKITARYLLKENPNQYSRLEQEKYRKSGLTQEQALQIKKRIDEAFEEDKLYRNNDIGLGDLADYIDQDRYKVSEVINTYYAKNFYALLNSYRIEEAKEILLSNPVISVKTVMYEVGFNSKNSFYTAFKRITGHSPNDFRSIASYDYGNPQFAS